VTRTLLILTVAAALFGVLAPAALASDDSVYQAYVSRDSDFTRLGNQLKKDLKAWVRSGRTKPAPALKTIRQSRSLCGDVVTAMKAESPSSSNGTKAKKQAIASVRSLSGSLKALAGGIRARTAHHLAKAKRLAAKADALLKRSLREQKRARRFFKAAGVQIKPA
jgi:hypothetical protein